jgi:hypothetical protein
VKTIDLNEVKRQEAQSRMATTALSGFIPFQIGDLKSAIEGVRRIKVSFQSAGMSRPASSGQHFWG